LLVIQHPTSFRRVERLFRLVAGEVNRRPADIVRLVMRPAGNRGAPAEALSGQAA